MKNFSYGSYEFYKSEIRHECKQRKTCNEDCIFFYRHSIYNKCLAEDIENFLNYKRSASDE